MAIAILNIVLGMVTMRILQKKFNFNFVQAFVCLIVIAFFVAFIEGLIKHFFYG